MPSSPAFLWSRAELSRFEPHPEDHWKWFYMMVACPSVSPAGWIKDDSYCPSIPLDFTTCFMTLLHDLLQDLFSIFSLTLTKPLMPPSPILFAWVLCPPSNPDTLHHSFSPSWVRTGHQTKCSFSASNCFAPFFSLEKFQRPMRRWHIRQHIISVRLGGMSREICIVG